MDKMTEEDFYRWIAQEIKSKRKMANLKAKELAKKVNVDPTFISKVEGGLKLSAYRFYEILYELGHMVAVVEKKRMYHPDVPEEEQDEIVDTEEEFNIWIGQQIRNIREKTGLKKVEVAQRTGLPDSFLANIENKGKKVSLYSFHKILDAMGYTFTFVEKKKVYHIDVPEEDRDELIHIADEVDEGLKHLPDVAEEDFFAKWSRFKAKLRTLLDVDVETIIQDIQKDADLQQEAARTRNQNTTNNGPGQ
jgi:transcriptional regulator with XRE-family HTH domain